MNKKTKAVISLDSITFIRSDRVILDNLSFAVLHGEHWALLGPNGCGKTTLLNIITGYLWPSSGSVNVLGDRYGEVDLRLKRRKIGIVSSALSELVPANDTFLDILLSGRFGSLGIYDEPDSHDRERARAIAAFLGRAHIQDRPYRVLSFGERQSALIGRALMAEPAILILDEPFEGLDMGTREHLMTRIDSLLADPSGPTVLFVTHRVEEIPPGITHAALMREGRIIHCGPKPESLTSGAIHDAFGVTVDLVNHNGRLYAHVL
jgi:iron complex transport system ATP-binding protein